MFSQLFKVTFIVLSMAVVAHAAVEQKRVSCADEKGFPQNWNLLADQEPALDWVIYKMAERAKLTPEPIDGKTSYVRFTNCTIEYPVENGQAIDGLRKVDADIQWYTKSPSGASVFQQDGTRVEYMLQSGKRDLVTLQMCRGEANCARLGIPFKGGGGSSPIPFRLR